MNALIVGARGVGKSTLIRRVLETLGRPVTGFETEKKGIRSIFMMRGRSMRPQRKIWWACAEKHAGCRCRKDLTVMHRGSWFRQSLAAS